MKLPEYMTWQDAWKLPLKFLYSKALDAKSNMAFDFASHLLSEGPVAQISKEDKQRLIDIVNGDKEPVKSNTYSYEDGWIMFHQDGQKLPFLLIRGWGHLTGSGGLNLQPETAGRLQDEFAQYIISRLTNRSTAEQVGENEGI